MQCQTVMHSQHLNGDGSAPLASMGRHDAAVTRVIAEVGRLTSLERRSSCEIRELVGANRRKDKLIEMAVEELRGPLASVRHAIMLLGQSTHETTFIERLQALMERRVQYMSRIVGNLLDVSRISNGQMQLKRERIDLRSVVNNAIQTLSPQIEAGRHQLITSLPEEPLWLMADRQRLEQVFVNLLDNAAKYSAPAGHFAVWVHAGESEAIVRIRDAGQGIAPQLLPHIFDVQRREDDPSPQSVSGPGIGLCVVRKLIQLHGGSVIATSRGAGQGSEFTVRLPRAA
jgi:signal transduction histidine kinase